MGHTISGIVTSFKYTGDLPNVVLVGNYHLIPFTSRYSKQYMDQVIQPFDELTFATRKYLKELSFKGKCAYIETDYFGGAGIQLAEVWENGERITETLFSYDGIESPKNREETTVVSDAINECLRTIGIYCHEGKDEFDSVNLGWYRDNKEVIEAYENNLLKNN